MSIALIVVIGYAVLATVMVALVFWRVRMAIREHHSKKNTMTVITRPPRTTLWLLTLSVLDEHGKLWLPLLGYDGEVVAYAPELEACTSFMDNRHTLCDKKEEGL